MNSAAGPGHSLMIWALAIVSILLVTGITYVYTNRNSRAAIIAGIVSVFLSGFISLSVRIHTELNQSFLGQYDQFNNASLAAIPGWGLLIHGWHIWILPVIFIGFIFSLIVYALWHYKASGGPKLEVHSPLIMPIPASAIKTSSEKLNTFMMVDAAKKQTQAASQKLTEALLANATYEMTMSDLKGKVKDLEAELAQTHKKLTETTETLELELSAKTQENDYLTKLLSTRTQELKTAQNLLKKLS